MNERQEIKRVKKYKELSLQDKQKIAEDYKIHKKLVLVASMNWVSDVTARTVLRELKIPIQKVGAPKIELPEPDILRELLKTTSRQEVARLLGVSKNTISRRVN